MEDDSRTDAPGRSAAGAPPAVGSSADSRSIDGDPRATSGALSRRGLLRAGATGLCGLGFVGAASPAVGQSRSEIPILDVTEETSVVDGSLPDDPSDLLLFVHGWQGTADVEWQVERLRVALDDAGYDHPVLGVRWDATDPDFAAAQAAADVAGERIAAWLESYRAEQPSTGLRAAAHSLGSRTALSALAAAASDAGEPPLLDSVALLGAAVVGDAVCPDGPYYAPVTDAAGEVHSYRSENDDTICGLFGAAGGGLGCAGAACGGTPENYADVDVTDRVGGHMAYFEPDDGCVDAVVERVDADPAEDGCRAAAVTDVDGVDPRDANGDGLYRDVTGDGSVGQTDVVQFFEVQHRSPFQERPSCFDYSGNGAVGHGDVVALFEDVARR